MKRDLFCAALLAWSGIASAVVYKWADAQGKIQYGDHPPDGVHAEVVELLGSHAPRVPAPAAAARSARVAGVTAAAAAQDEAAKKAVQEDVAQSRDKECADAQDRYKKLIEGRRLFKTGADGERQYLSSEEIDAERVNAKRDIDTICNSPT